MDIFKNKVAIVTGGASGMGRAICEQLGLRGAIVTVADINKEGAEKVAKEISEAGGKARGAYLDVTNEDGFRKLINDAASEHGRLDYLFNNAGIAIGGEVHEIEMEHWRRIFDVNLFGLLYGTLEAYSLMIKQGFGHIVNTSSMAGLVESPLLAPYCTSKHGVLGLSTSLRALGAGFGVKVSVVCPGIVETSMIDSIPIISKHKGAPSFRKQVEGGFNTMSATKAAKIILKGVEQNKNIIVFPFTHRVLWWIKRLHPDLLAFLFRKSVIDYRNACKES